MTHFMHFIEEKMTPLAHWMGGQRHLQALQNGFMSVLPLIFVGAVFMIIANPPVTAEMIADGGIASLFTGWYDFATQYKMTMLTPFNMTMGLLGLAVAFVIAYQLGKSYDMNGLTCGMTSLITFLIVAAPASYVQLVDESVSLMMSCTYLGAQGLFTAILIAICTVEITRFCEQHHITIRLPKVCPPALTESFNTIVPMLINIAIFFGMNLVIMNTMNGLTLPGLIEMILAKPISAVDSIPGTLLLCAFTLLLWCCGVHGNMVTMAVTTPITTAAFASNAALVAAGQAPVFHPIFMVMAMTFLGGTGNTFGFCLLAFARSRSQQLKAFGKVCIVPSCFRISEPVLFGAPIMFNPILMIPFLLNGLIVPVLYWIVCTLGIVTSPYLMISGTYPIFVSIFVMCLDWRVLLFVAAMIPLTVLIWYPFFKVYDNQLLEEETAQAEDPAAEIVNKENLKEEMVYEG